MADDSIFTLGGIVFAESNTPRTVTFGDGQRELITFSFYNGVFDVVITEGITVTDAAQNVVNAMKDLLRSPNE